MPAVELNESSDTRVIGKPLEADVPQPRPLRDEESTRPVDAPQCRRPRPLTGCTISSDALRLDERRGRGGAGLVYRATQTVTGRTMAVKVLRDGRASARATFLREAEVLRDVRSPWVVCIARTGILGDGRLWFAMEYLRGHSLARELRRRGRIGPRRAIDWLRQACRGLAAIHEEGWVHRDVKPSNLMLVSEPDGIRLKIIDLGIAERPGTIPEMMCGTPDYIAPEQVRNESVDIRSDIYSLGCCAYQMLTGRSIVPENGTAAKLRAHLDGVDVSWPNAPFVPQPLRDIISRTLAPNLEDRPATMLEVDELLGSLPYGTRRASPIGARRVA